MSLVLQDILDHIVSHAMATGVFERVNQHEPKNAPGNGITANIFVDRVIPTRSGLASTSAKVTFNVRLMSNMIAEPQDAIDPNLVDAMDALFIAYTGDFQFDGTVYAVDLLGEEGETLSADFGYVEQDRKMYRICNITLPVIVSDVWDQTP